MDDARVRKNVEDHMEKWAAENAERYNSITVEKFVYDFVREAMDETLRQVVREEVIKPVSDQLKGIFDNRSIH